MSSDGYTLKWISEKTRARVKRKLWRLAEAVLVRGTPEEREWLRIQMAEMRESGGIRHEEIERMRDMLERYEIG